MYIHYECKLMSNLPNLQEYKTYKDNFIKRFELLRLPEYLIITYDRFHKNQWFIEKNPTIVNFPIRYYSCENNE